MNSDDLIPVASDRSNLEQMTEESHFTSTSQDQVEETSLSNTLVPAMNISDMPDEILEHILGFLSPYKEMDDAKLVCKHWNHIVKSLVKQLRRKFYQSLSRCDIGWSFVPPEVQAGHTDRVIKGRISDRFSHSTVYYNGSMYVFGGCTSTNTTFNDLWRLDLTTRKWIRPIAKGTYPSPKACATMVEYNGNLVLFGGWSHPIPYPLHQSAHYFSELHVYNTVTNQWSHVLSLGQEPEALGGHSASVAGHLMVVFGGSPRPGLGTNNLWVFNFLKASWTLQPVSSDVKPDKASCTLQPVSSDVKPEPRYGQFQTTLDDKHILIMGGCVGQNKIYSDLWLLTLHETEPWQWTKLAITYPELAAPQTWCHATCRVKDTIIVIARSSKVRHTRNIITHTRPRPLTNSRWSSSDSGSSAESSPVSTELHQVDHSPRPQQHQVDHSPRPQLHQIDHSPKLQHYQHPPQQIPTHQHHGGAGREVIPTAQLNNNLLSIQQRLHRECLNLPDSSNHHHQPQRADAEETDGYYLRIFNKWENQQAGPSSHQQLQEHANRQPLPSVPGQNLNQLLPGSSQSPAQNLTASPRPRGSGCMPSIRPNAMNNRQKQLEALQRQEDLLRLKSNALAAARNQKSSDSSDDVSPEQQVPELVPTRNKMDVHVLDISKVLTEGTAEWKPLHELQPTGAPTETICCSVLEGRGELVLFGGVVRNVASPTMTNTAVNKLYILQPQ